MATKDEKKRLNKIAELGCILCSEIYGFEGTPSELHHVRRHGSVRSTSPVLALCPEHHRNGNDSLHRLGVNAFEDKHGITCAELLERQDKRLGKGYGE
jgi:Recombination enhancement, RecA-dependent nuclease